MIEQSGTVVSVRGDVANVEARSSTACGGCAVDGHCSTALIGRYFGRKEAVLVARNDIGARPGDRVVVGVPESALLAAAFVVYLVPLFGMICGAIAGAQIAALLVPEHGQEASVLAGMAGFAGALYWVRRFSLAKSSDERYRPRVLRHSGWSGQQVVPLPKTETR